MTEPPLELTTVGVPHYPHAIGWDVQEVAAAVNDLARLLERYGFIVHDRSAQAADLDSTGTMMDEWTEQPSTGSILYWGGHGVGDEKAYVAALASSKDPLGRRNGHSHEQFAEALRDRQGLRQDDELGHWVLLILDTCGSRLGARHVFQQMGDLPNTVVIGTAEAGGAAFAGRFVQQLTAVLEGFGGNDTDGIRVDEVLSRLRVRLAPEVGSLQRIFGEIHHSITMSLPASTPPAVQATVDAQREFQAVLANVDPRIRNHFFAKAQGAELGTPAWHFTGRVTERRQIVHWLSSTEDGMLVVTGRAGSGKSAILGMLLACSDPAFVDALTHLGYPGIADDLRPAEDAFTAAIQLSGLTITDTVRAISTATTNAEPTSAPDTLAAALADRPTGSPPLTLLLDALDESRDARTIAALLRRLGRIPGVRLVVGTRVSLTETPDRPPTDTELLDTLGRNSTTITIGDDPAAVHDYVTGRLTDRLPPESRYTLAEVADKVVDRKQPFLFARLAVYEVLADPSRVTSQARFDELLAHGHAGIFTLAVARLAASDPVAEGLLHVLAYARGNGFPRSDGIWATAGSALTATEVTDLDIARTLELAAPYIMEDTEFGQAVYRLAHRTFAEHYWTADSHVDR